MLYLLLAQAAQAEPPPAGWTSHADYVVKTTATYKEVVFPLLAFAVPTAILIGLGLLVVKFGLPRIDLWVAAYRAEKTSDREHLSALIAAREKDSAQDLDNVRRLAMQQHQAIVERVEAKVDRNTGEIAKLSERSERHGELLRDVARKVGVVVLLVVLVACPAPLNVQQTLADRVRAASAQCKALPVGAAKTALCTRALLCQTQALAAAESLQRVQVARASGDTDVAAETSAAGLSVLAEAACCAWATKPCRVLP